MNVMGQLLDKAKRNVALRTIPNEKPPTNALPIRILELEAKIENRPTVLDEKSSAVLKYRTPHFRYAINSCDLFPEDFVFLLGNISEQQQPFAFLH